MRLAAVVISVAIIWAPIYANSQALYAGAGVQTCDTFNQDYAFNSERFEVFYFTWAQGFMAGLNDAAVLSGDVSRDLASQSNEVQFARIRVTCGVAPELLYIHAVRSLYQTLDENPPLGRAAP